MTALPTGFLLALNADPWEQVHRLAAADWCADQQGYGCGSDRTLWLWEQQLRFGPPPLGLMFFSGSGDGDGDGSGSGSGSGDGDGSGSGSGSGDGHGDGYGHGDGDRLTLDGGRIVPEVGLNQLIVLPHGWVICGYVAEQIGPYQFRVLRAVVICRTGGRPWDELADGKGRDAATYRAWGDVTIGPQFVMSRPWKGDLPLEGAK